MAGSTDQSSVFPESDVLMKDNTYLDYINDILMDEGMDDDAVWLQQADGTSSSSYDAIFRSLQDILAGSPPVSPDQYNEEASLQHVEGTQSFQAIFSSLQNIIRADSAPTRHHQSMKLPQAENSPTVHSGSAMKLQPEVDLCSLLSCDVYDTMPRNYEGRILEFMSPGLLSSQGLHMEGLHGQSSNGTFKLPADQVQGLDVSFEELKLHDVYTSLYVDRPSSSTVASRNDRNKPARSTAYKGKICEKHTPVTVLIDVREALISCAQAVAKGNVMRATQILQEIHQVYGTSAQYKMGHLRRVAYIFSRALAARMRGTGVQEYDAMSRDMPSSAAILRVGRLDFEVIPYKKLVHYYANQSILQAAKGASSMHIVDYGLSAYGLQWPCLINALADCKGVSPLLVITFIGFPESGLDMARRLEESGQRLAAYAKTYNVPFEYHVIVSDKWEDLDAASLQLCSNPPEVLIINCMTGLRFVSDDTIILGKSTISKRQKLFDVWHSLNPHLLVTTALNGALNSAFFVTRFREALDFFTNGFDMLDTLWGDRPERLVMERGFYYRTIMNIVACEGAERVERAENYRQWHVRITKAGFAHIPIPSTILATSKLHMRKTYHNDFFLDDDGNGWMLLGWKGRATIAISTWKPTRVSQ